MIKRGFDIVASVIGLLVSAPILIPVLIAVWLQDFKSPLHIAIRVARGGGTFRMIKIRSMVARAEQTGVTSTGADDSRITPIGKLVRACKIDEVAQLWNVLTGDMSLVGPRPQVKPAVDSYTALERRLLTVRPGITDPASIVFSDEGEILRGSLDPDLLYDQIIRPWKSRLALIYIDHISLAADLYLIFLTILAAVSKRSALNRVAALLHRWGANENVIAVARRTGRLLPYPPPGVLHAGAAS